MSIKFHASPWQGIAFYKIYSRKYLYTVIVHLLYSARVDNPVCRSASGESNSKYKKAGLVS